jgi:hypothetical protein
MYIGLHVKYPLFLSDFTEPRIFAADFRKIFNIYFLLSSGSRLVPCGPMDGQTDRPTYMMKPIVSCHNSVNAPKKAENILFGRETRKTEFYDRDTAPYSCGLSLEHINWLNSDLRLVKQQSARIQPRPGHGLSEMKCVMVFLSAWKKLQGQ